MHIPKRAATIEKHIKDHKRELNREKRMFGGFMDSAGRRYMLVPLYAVLGDWPGAVRSYRWFEKNFSDDIGDSFHFLCGSLAFFHTGKRTIATNILKKAMLSNLYLLPRLFGQELDKLDIRHSSNLEEPESLDYAPPELWALWDDESLQWAMETYESPQFTLIRERYIELKKQLMDEPVGPRRSQLVATLSKLQYD